MKNILLKLIVVGRVKDAHYQAKINEFMQRLNAFGKIEVVELKDDTVEKVTIDGEKVVLSKYRVLDHTGRGEIVGRGTFFNPHSLLVFFKDCEPILQVCHSLHKYIILLTQREVVANATQRPFYIGGYTIGYGQQSSPCETCGAGVIANGQHFNEDKEHRHSHTFQQYKDFVHPFTSD